MFERLRAKLSDEYRAYADKGKMYSKQEQLKRAYQSVIKDLRHTQARTKEQIIQTAKSLYELADCAVKCEVEQHMEAPLYYRMKRLRWKNRLRRCALNMDNQKLEPFHPQSVVAVYFT